MYLKVNLLFTLKSLRWLEKIANRIGLVCVCVHRHTQKLYVIYHILRVFMRLYLSVSISISIPLILPFILLLLFFVIHLCVGYCVLSTTFTIFGLLHVQFYFLCCFFSATFSKWNTHRYVPLFYCTQHREEEKNHIEINTENRSRTNFSKLVVFGP